MTDDNDLFDIDSGKFEPAPTTRPDCALGVHDYPNQDFAVGPRTCDLCGNLEY